MKKRKKGKRNYEKENLAAYRRCLRKEKEREKDRRETEQGSFDAYMLHLDDSATLGDDAGDGEADGDQSPYWESDNGEGGEVVRSFDEPTAMAIQSEYTRRLHNARRRLKRHNSNLLCVFDLVVKNGTDKEESVWELMTLKTEQEMLQDTCTMTTSKKY